MRKLFDLFFVVIDKIRSLFLCWWFRHQDGIDVGSNIVLTGTPSIEVRNGGRVIIGDGVLLHSKTRSLHLSIYSPVRLCADRPGAVISIGDQSRIAGASLHAHASIKVGRKCMIGANCQIFDSSGHELSFDNVENRIHTTGQPNPVIIEDCVWIGANCFILPGVKIGRGSVISAGSVVASSIPPMSVAIGNPAKVIMKHKATETEHKKDLEG